MPNNDTCSVPPALTDDQLAAYLAGNTEKHVKSHLEACAFCRARLADLHFGSLLKVNLYRFDCPDSQKLTDYAMAILPDYERDTITNHLTYCLSCQEEIKMLQAFLANDVEMDEPLPTATSTQPKRRHPQEHIARVSQLPMASALRGRLHGPILASVSDALNIFFEYNESVQTTTLKGQIVADDVASWHSAIVTIFHNLNLVATTIVDELGAFQCDLSAIIPVQIRITAPSGETISIPELLLDEES